MKKIIILLSFCLLFLVACTPSALSAQCQPIVVSGGAEVSVLKEPTDTTLVPGNVLIWEIDIRNSTSLDQSVSCAVILRDEVEREVVSESGRMFYQPPIPSERMTHYETMLFVNGENKHPYVYDFLLNSGQTYQVMFGIKLIEAPTIGEWEVHPYIGTRPISQ